MCCLSGHYSGFIKLICCIDSIDLDHSEKSNLSSSQHAEYNNISH